MSITIEMTPDLEQKLREEAARLGVQPSEYVVITMQERLARQPAPRTLSAEQTELLEEINLGLSPVFWHRFHVLREKRQAEALSSDEQSELVRLSDQIEEANARRMRALIRLANVQGVSIDELMDTLGLKAPDYA